MLSMYLACCSLSNTFLASISRTAATSRAIAQPKKNPKIKYVKWMRKQWCKGLEHYDYNIYYTFSTDNKKRVKKWDAIAYSCIQMRFMYVHNEYYWLAVIALLQICVQCIRAEGSSNSPEKNVTLCFSFLNFGLSDFMPSLRLNLEKYLMKASSTLSKRHATYDRKTPNY